MNDPEKIRDMLFHDKTVSVIHYNWIIPTIDIGMLIKDGIKKSNHVELTNESVIERLSNSMLINKFVKKRNYDNKNTPEKNEKLYELQKKEERRISKIFWENFIRDYKKMKYYFLELNDDTPAGSYIESSHILSKVVYPIFRCIEYNWRSGGMMQ